MLAEVLLSMSEYAFGQIFWNILAYSICSVGSKLTQMVIFDPTKAFQIEKPSIG